MENVENVDELTDVEFRKMFTSRWNNITNFLKGKYEVGVFVKKQKRIRCSSGVTKLR